MHGMDMAFKFCTSDSEWTFDFIFHSFQALYTILAPYVSPFFSTTWFFHSGTFTAFTHRLGSTQNPARGPLAGAPSTAGTSMYLPV